MFYLLTNAIYVIIHYLFSFELDMYRDISICLDSIIITRNIHSPYRGQMIDNGLC